MAMSATSSYDYDYYPEIEFVQIWRGTEDRSKEFEQRIERLFPCPTCKQIKTAGLFCSNSFHL